MTFSPGYKGSLHESHALEHPPHHSRGKEFLAMSYAYTGPVPPLLVCNPGSDDSIILCPSGPEPASRVWKELFPGSVFSRTNYTISVHMSRPKGRPRLQLFAWGINKA